MTGRDFLPRQDVALTDSAQRTTTPFYVWMQGIDRLLAGGATLQEIEEAIAELKSLIADLPSGSFLPATTMVLGQGSVVQFGTLAGGVVFLKLVNDADAPGNTYYYGTGPDGTKGWHTVESALAVQDLISKTVAANGVTTIGKDVLTHTEASPVTPWTINHNLGRRVNVGVYTAGGVEVFAEVLLASDNQAIVTFDAPTAGYAVID